MICKDIHCLGRLKEGLAISNEYKDIAMKFMVESNLTWDDATKSLSIFDGSIALKEKINNESNQLLEQNKLGAIPTHSSGTEAVKRVKPSKSSNGNKYCKVCKKKGHLASECWHRSGNKNENFKSKTNLSIVCHRCGKKGHIAPKCRTRRKDDVDEVNGYNYFF